jgi:hypothetical protein
VHWLHWIFDTAGALVILALVYAVALIARRRVISRQGGTFELSHRVRPRRGDGRGWVLGLGRYSGETLEWFRVFTLSPRPKRTWRREWLSYDGTREPLGTESLSLYPDQLVIRCQSEGGEIEMAMSLASLTGFQSWLEARPPGTDWNR